MALNKLGYAFQLHLTSNQTLEDIRLWLREADIMGPPSDDPAELPERVFFFIGTDPAAGNGAGATILNISFPDIADAQRFEAAFGDPL